MYTVCVDDYLDLPQSSKFKPATASSSNPVTSTGVVLLVPYSLFSFFCSSQSAFAAIFRYTGLWEIKDWL